MANTKVNISEAELEIMKVLWTGEGPMTAQSVSDALAHKNWKYSTIATLCARMVEKGTVTYERKGRFYYYTPTVTEHEYKASQTKSLISKLYNGSVKNLVAALFENEELSAADMAELKKKFNL